MNLELEEDLQDFDFLVGDGEAVLDDKFEGTARVLTYLVEKGYQDKRGVKMNIDDFKEVWDRLRNDFGWSYHYPPRSLLTQDDIYYAPDDRIVSASVFEPRALAQNGLVEGKDYFIGKEAVHTFVRTQVKAYRLLQFNGGVSEETSSTETSPEQPTSTGSTGCDASDTGGDGFIGTQIEVDEAELADDGETDDNDLASDSAAGYAMTQLGADDSAADGSNGFHIRSKVSAHIHSRARGIGPADGVENFIQNMGGGYSDSPQVPLSHFGSADPTTWAASGDESAAWGSGSGSCYGNTYSRSHRRAAAALNFSQELATDDGMSPSHVRSASQDSDGAYDQRSELYAELEQIDARALTTQQFARIWDILRTPRSRRAVDQADINKWNSHQIVLNPAQYKPGGQYDFLEVPPHGTELVYFRSGLEWRRVTREHGLIYNEDYFYSQKALVERLQVTLGIITCMSGDSPVEGPVRTRSTRAASATAPVMIGTAAGSEPIYSPAAQGMKLVQAAENEKGRSRGVKRNAEADAENVHPQRRARRDSNDSAEVEV